ncbi:hypothetical protein MRQ36_26875 [Micromonospora sp. R77]|uniref:hypothetical protein n=1 Tax=Micromonospora sp. R77 TaxID=2925836 RepID=UPI001F61CD65|nr:hypothetical protein [Micromonospora sp. R77]MCI4065978.1 hypothetical protein [Micromonospora sp. R77]
MDFTRPPARGRGWLVCVDGVDAVTDPDDRGRVLNRLADAARSGGAETTGPGPWRVLVTTRQLAGSELAVLRDYQAHHLVPFTDADVQLLASRWFPTAATAAAFLRWLRDQRIGEPVRNPLTATIAALVWDNEWAGAIPGTGPAALLEGFVAALLAGGRATLEAVAGQLRARARRGTPGRLVDHPPARAGRGRRDRRPRRRRPGRRRRGLVGPHAPGPPAAVAADCRAGPRRAARHRPVPRAAGGRADRPGDLVAPAALLPAGAGLLDYVAAGPLADDWREDRWIAAMTTTGDRGLGLYALTRVATAPDFLQRMAAQGPAGAVSAGYALAAGQPVADAVRAEVLAALLTHWSAHPGTADPDADADPARECLSVLTTLAAVRSTRELLRRIGTDPQRPTVVREAAALFFAVRQQTAGPRTGADVAGAAAG